MPPSYMPAVNSILRDIPASSLRTFQRAFIVTELLASVSFSMNNIIQGAICTGAIKDGSGSGPCYEKILENCPVIKAFTDKDRTRIATLIVKCQQIADEMILEKINNSINYLGTPDDQRMVAAFGELFGEIHIGTGIRTSGNRVTDLEFIRWRTTLYGANGQLEINAKKKLARLEKASFDSSTIAMALPGLPSSIVETETIVASGEQGNKTVIGRLGKKCSNINCPDHARYRKALANLWSKCPKNCGKCDTGGSVHVCANEQCKAILSNHILI